MSATVKITASSVSPNSGPTTGNTKITITGSGFKSVPEVPVLFGAAGASDIKVISDTEITAVSPNTANAGSITIYIVNGLGVNISAGTFTYKKPQEHLPKITSVSPSQAFLTENKKIILEGENLSGVNAVNFGVLGVLSKDFQLISDTQINVTSPSAPKAETVHVTVIDSQGVPSEKGTSNQFKYAAAPNNGIPFIFDANSPTDTYVQFLGDTALEGHYYDSSGTKKTLKPHTGYLLSSLVSTTPVIANAPVNVPAVLVKSFSGRTYMSLGAAIPGMEANFIPNANDDTVNSLYQYFEPTVDKSQLNIDLSYIDFTAFSLSLAAKNAPHGTNKSQSSKPSADLINATAGSARITNGSKLSYASSSKTPTSKFLRVISPQLGNAGLYHDFTNYLKTKLKNKTVKISGTYVGTVINKVQQPTGNPLTQAQSYDYTGTFDSAGNITLSPNAGSGNGSAAGVPTIQQGSGVGVSGGDIVISFADFNDKIGIYGCNTPYKLGSNSKTAGITNDIYGQVVGDLLAGLNFGYVGSDVMFVGKDKKIGDLSSTEWWGGTSFEGTAINPNTTPGGTGIYFSGAQSNAKNYNSYSASIASLTSGYGFPLQDRLGKNLMTLNTSKDQTAYLKIYVDKQIS
tara:strand:+ start:4431 stop:6317 length:1887 start_codon:yes stop_codon:yes gene_type:complete